MTALPGKTMPVARRMEGRAILPRPGPKRGLFAGQHILEPADHPAADLREGRALAGPAMAERYASGMGRRVLRPRRQCLSLPNMISMRLRRLSCLMALPLVGFGETIGQSLCNLVDHP
nr:hypothetical protein [Cereibacter johrii]